MNLEDLISLVDRDKYKPLIKGCFDNKDGVFNSFNCTSSEIDFVKEVLIAEYRYRDYNGDASVLFLGVDNKLYEVHGGHCSCYGLEGQWGIEETSVEYFQERLDRGAYVDEDVVLLFGLEK